MKRTQADKETMAHNLLAQPLFTRDNVTYLKAHKALCSLSFEALDAIWFVTLFKEHKV
jgi:hypothetical protein